MLFQKIEEHIEAMGPFGFSMFQHFSFCCNNAMKIPKLRPTTNVFIVFRKEFSISPPARCRSLDFNKGATPLPSSFSFLLVLLPPRPPSSPLASASSRCCGARLGPNTIWPPPDAVEGAWYHQLRIECPDYMSERMSDGMSECICHIYFQMDPDGLSETMSE